MDKDKYEKLCERLDELARKNPLGYRLRVLVLALAGYGYLLAAAGLLPAMAALLGYALFHWQTGASSVVSAAATLLTAFAVIRAFSIKAPAPIGLEIRAEQAPGLFNAIEDIRRKLKGPRTGHVLITADMGAAIVRIPRLGPLGICRNYILLGLPLLESLDTQDFKAILAHEYGLFSARHGRFGAFIHKTRETWGRLERPFTEKKDWAAFLLFPFYTWFTPFFLAYTQALARTQRLSADRASAEVAGPSRAADALVSLHVKSLYLEESFWSNIGRIVAKSDTIPSPYAQMGDLLSKTPGLEEGAGFLVRGMAMITGCQSSLPCLSERLAALGHKARLPGPASATAAKELLGNLRGELAFRLDQGWANQMEDRWESHKEEVWKSELNLAQLDEKALKHQLSNEDLFERAVLTREYGDKGEALKRYLECLKRIPDMPEALYWAGRLLLDTRDPRGLNYLERAMKMDQDYILPACERAYGFLATQKQMDKAQRYAGLLQEYFRKREPAARERSALWEEDRLAPHGLSRDQALLLARKIAGYAQVEAAYLAQKVVEHFPGHPLYVLGVVCPGVSDPQQAVTLLDSLLEQLDFPGQAIGMVMDQPSTTVLSAKLRETPDAAIYAQGRPGLF